MDITNYYAESIISKIAYNLGRGVKAVQVVTTQSINPLKAIGAVTIGWGSISAIVNMTRYKKGKISKKEAVVVTANESVGLGLAAGLGLFTSNLLRTYLLAASTVSVLPFTIGVIVTATTKVVWDCKTKKNMLW